MKHEISRKSKSLKQAIERCNMYKRFVDMYNRTHMMDEYIRHLQMINTGASDTTLAYYDDLINAYKNGNNEPLLANLYEKLLSADELKRRLADELKDILRES